MVHIASDHDLELHKWLQHPRHLPV
jgi:hypothetical protein